MFADFDTNSVIFDMLPITDQAKLHKLFGQNSPSQYKISRELLMEKTDGNLRGYKGLFMLACNTGELEPCVQIMSKILNIPETERNIRQDFTSYDPGQRVDRIMRFKRNFS